MQHLTMAPEFGTLFWIVFTLCLVLLWAQSSRDE
jgi:hypothetical protein